MSKYSTKDITDKKGQILLESTLPPEWIEVVFFGSNDKTADIDGTLRLRDGKGANLNEFLFFQLKSTDQADPAYIDLKKNTIDFLCDSTVPTILFVADVQSKVVYWHIVDASQASKRKTQGWRVKLSDSISIDAFQHIRTTWRSIARKSNLVTSNSQLKAITSDYLADLRNIVGLLHLLKRARRKTFPALSSDFLGVEVSQISNHLSSLEKQGLITVTTNYLLLNDEQLGIENSKLLLRSENVDRLVNLLSEQNDKLLLVRSILELQEPWVEEWLKRFARKIARDAHESEKYTDKFNAIALLRELSSKIPAEAFDLLKPFAHTKPSPKLKFKAKIKSGDYKDVEEVILSACEGILYLLLIESRALDEVWKVFISSDASLKDKIKNAFKQILSYDLNAINSVGFAPQKTAVDFLCRLDETDISTNIGFICDLCSKLLEPTFNSIRMVDWETFQVIDGSMPATQELEIVRQKVINFLETVFLSNQNLKTRERVIYTLGEATQPSHFGKTTASHKAMILKNIVSIISFFKKHLSSMRLREIYLIEELIKEIDLFFGIENIAALSDLQKAIRSISEYQAIEALIGWGYLPNEEQKEAHDKRLDVMFNDISNKSFNTWKKRFEFLANDKELLSSKGYIILFNFIRRVGKEKPKIAKRLMNEPMLKPLFPNLLCGIEEAQETSFLKKWIRQNLTKHTEQISEFFHMSSNQAWRSLYVEVKEIAEKRKDTVTLRNLLDSLVLKKLTTTKYFSLALSLINKLSELKDRFWCLSFSRNEFLETATIKPIQAKLILDALLLSRKLEYHEIQILNYLGTAYHILIIDFLVKRIRYQRENNLDWLEYRAIPFNLERLEDILTKEPRITIDKLSPLLIEKDPRFGSEAKKIFKECLSQNESEFEKAINRLLNNPTVNSIKIACRLLRQINNKDLYCQLARQILQTKKVSTKAKKEICYHIATFDKLPEEVKNWEYIPDPILIKVTKEIKKYKAELEQQKKRWKENHDTKEILEGLDEHKELRKRGLSNSIK